MAESSIIIYSAILGVILLYFIMKYKRLTTTILCLSLYFVSSLTSIYFFKNCTYNYSGITIYPMLYLTLCLLVSIYPLIQYDKINANINYLSVSLSAGRFLNTCILFFALLSIEPFIENIIRLPLVLSNQGALSDFYDAREEGIQNEYLSWFGRKCYWIGYLLRDTVPILFFYYLLFGYNNKYSKYIILGLGLAFLNPIIHSFNLGGRSVIISNVFYLLFVYVVFRQFFTKELVKKIDTVFFVSISVVVVAIAIITIARYASRDMYIDVWTWVSLYTGEGVLNFASDLWPLDKTCNGDNTFLMLRYFLGLTDNYDIESVRVTRDFLGIRNKVFYTYIGTIYYDFNKIGTVIFLLISSFLFTKITKVCNSKIHISKLIYLCILGKALMMGVMFYPYTLWNDQLSLLLLLIFTFVLSLKEKQLYKPKA